MSDNTFALVTPSFWKDFDRCRLLVNSVHKYVPAPTRQYLVVDRKDYKLFSALEGERTEILCVEDILPWWIFRLPGAKRWWLSFKTPPLRNWILQQLVKLSIPAVLQEDVVIFADSDVALIRPFDPATFVRDDKVRLYRRPDFANLSTHRRWHRAAGELLGIEVKDYYGANYIGNLISWKRENVLKLHKHIENVSGRGWLETIGRQWHLSEYILYGVFAEHVLQDHSRVYFDDKVICLEHWLTDDLPEAELKRLLSNVTEDHIAVMISAKAALATDQLENLLDNMD